MADAHPATSLVAPPEPAASRALLALRCVLAMLITLGWAHTLGQLTARPLEDAVREAPVVSGLGWQGALASLAVLAALVLLVAGPQPHLATKWAWFWLAGAPPLWIAFLLLEPAPAWTRTAPPPRRRLTGGWAFLLSLTLVPIVLSLIPGLRW